MRLRDLAIRGLFALANLHMIMWLSPTAQAETPRDPEAADPELVWGILRVLPVPIPISPHVNRFPQMLVLIRGGILILNQRVDLVEEQLEELWLLGALGSQTHLPGVCVTTTS